MKREQVLIVHLEGALILWSKLQHSVSFLDSSPVFILWDRERHYEEEKSCCTKQLCDLFLDWTWASRTEVECANHQTITFPSGYIDDLFFVCLFF